MKKNSKYRYVSGQMYEHHGTRMYDFGGIRLPSVTTILSATKDQQFWEGVSKNDCYFTAKECLEYGIIDEIIT